MFCLGGLYIYNEIECFIGDLVHLSYFLLFRKAWNGKCIHFQEMDQSCKLFRLG